MEREKMGEKHCPEEGGGGEERMQAALMSPNLEQAHGIREGGDSVRNSSQQRRVSWQHYILENQSVVMRSGSESR